MTWMPHELTSHQPPALLVAELLSATADGHGGTVRLDNQHGLDLWQCIEGCAQAVAVILGHHLRQHGGGAAGGMLVGVRDAALTAPIRAGAVVEVHAEQVQQLAPLRVFSVRVTANGAPCFHVELKVIDGANA